MSRFVYAAFCWAWAGAFLLWSWKPAWRSNWLMRCVGWNCPTESAAKRNAVLCYLMSLWILFPLDRFVVVDILVLAGAFVFLVLHIRDFIRTNVDSPEFKLAHGIGPSHRD